MSNVNSNPSTETLYIVMPAYNEAENLPHVIGRWYNCLRLAGPDSRLVILDDGSRDNTPEIMGELTELYPQLRYERRENAGHGNARLRAYRWRHKRARIGFSDRFGRSDGSGGIPNFLGGTREL